MKLFTTKSIETVKYCQEYFDFFLPSVLWAKRVAKFEVSLECFFVCAIIDLISFVLHIVIIVFGVCLVNKDSQRSRRIVPAAEVRVDDRSTVEDRWPRSSYHQIYYEFAARATSACMAAGIVALKYNYVACNSIQPAKLRLLVGSF